MVEGAKDDKWEACELQLSAADKSPKEELSLHRCISKCMVLNIQMNDHTEDNLMCIFLYPKLIENKKPC